MQILKIIIKIVICLAKLIYKKINLIKSTKKKFNIDKHFRIKIRKK